jgi:hypothetical protein
LCGRRARSWRVQYPGKEVKDESSSRSKERDCGGVIHREIHRLAPISVRVVLPFEPHDPRLAVEFQHPALWTAPAKRSGDGALASPLHPPIPSPRVTRIACFLGFMGCEGKAESRFTCLRNPEYLDPVHSSDDSPQSPDHSKASELFSGNRRKLPSTTPRGALESKT